MQKISFILIIILIASSGLIAYSGPYYVATNGFDSSSGSNLAPFRTIQHAANVMITNVTIASCYIYPGIYSEQVEIYSNKNTGYMVFTALSNNNPPILTGSLMSNHGFCISNASSVIIKGLIIKKYTNGIILTGIATNNYIIKNAIYSNDNYGVYLRSGSAKNNYIINNNIWGTNQHCGIYISDGDNNIIQSNYIHQNVHGIYFDGNAKNNYIIRNLIYTNYNDGIYINSENADNNYILTNNIFWNQRYGIEIWNGDYNLVQFNQIYNNNDYGVYLRSGSVENNYIINNNIWGTNQSRGICIYDGKNNIIRANQIHNLKGGGIYCFGSAQNNKIIKNLIYSNNYYGVTISTPAAINNSILTNQIWDINNSYGIYINNCNDNKIYRNLIYNIQTYGISITGTASNVLIINNTIFRSRTADGVRWGDTSCGTMYNNIILSNGNGVNDYGIQNGGTGVVYASHNCIYGNWDGAMTNSGGGSLVWGPGNTTESPLIDTTGFFVIVSANSPCVDSGIVISGVSDVYEGEGPDMGWKEFHSEASPSEETNVESQIKIPDDFAVYPNYLDLSVGETANIVIGKLCNVEIRIYNIMGDLVKSYPMQCYSKGEKIEWRGTIRNTNKKVCAGIYIVVIKGDNVNKKLKMIIRR